MGSYKIWGLQINFLICFVSNNQYVRMLGVCLGINMHVSGISFFVVMVIFHYDVVITIYCNLVMFLYLMASVLLFTQPVVDAFDPRLLVAPPIFHVIDFMKSKV